MGKEIKHQPIVARVEKISPIRKAIAKNLKEVMDKVAYTSLVQKVDASALWDHRLKVKDKIQKATGVKLTFLSWIIKATTIALSEFPMFSAVFNEETGEVTYPGTFNINIAVDTPYGLVVPVIRSAEKLSIVEIQKEIIRLAGLAKDRKLTMADMSGGCFTVSNVGSVGVLWGTPIMNKGQVAIIATGAIVDEALVRDGKVVAGKTMGMSIAADHRWVDGADMGRFNGRIKQLLENPESLGE